MKQISPFAAFFPVLLLTACFQETPSRNSDYLIAGVTYGECNSDCATLFLIQDGKVYPDNETQYRFGQIGQPQFASKALNDTTYPFAAGRLLADFPVYLTAHPDTTLGCPDCHDQGGYHLIQQVGGVRQAWYIDTDTAMQPVEIRAYMQQVELVVGGL